MAADTQFSIIHAYDGTPLREVAKDNAAAADTMLARADDLFRDPASPLPVWRRIEVLRTLMSLMENEAGDFALLIAKEGGKPLRDARIEVTRAINGVELAISDLGRHAGTEIPMDLSPGDAGRPRSETSA